jgi:hypothetical protein
MLLFLMALFQSLLYQRYSLYCCASTLRFPVTCGLKDFKVNNYNLHVFSPPKVLNEVGELSIVLTLPCKCNLLLSRNYKTKTCFVLN